MVNIGLDATRNRSSAPLITMLKKQGRRIIENADEIMVTLQQYFPSASLQSLQGHDVAQMSITDQVKSRRVA